MSETAFDKVIGVNLKGTFLVNQVASAAMMKAKTDYGSIVNISSISGVNEIFFPCYFALVGLSRIIFEKQPV